MQLADARHVAEGKAEVRRQNVIMTTLYVTLCHVRMLSQSVTAYVLRIVAELVGGPVLAESLAHGAQPQVVQRPHLVVVL